MHKNSIKNNFKFLIRKIFSLTNSEDKNYKLLTILGITIKIRRIPKKYKLIKHVPHKFELPAFQKPLVSIIIPVYNQYKYTERCLYSILKTVKDIPYEIIIADDCSKDETKHIEQNIKGVTSIKTTGNFGFLKNVKNAVLHAKAKYIFLMNNDILVTKNWLDALYKFLEQNQEVGVAGSLCLNSDNTIQEYGAWIDKDGVSHPNIPKETKLLNLRPLETEYCSGCAMMFLKSDWDKLGGFDEQFAPAYYEDSDFCYQIKYNLNKKVYCVPTSKIFHFRSKTYSVKANELSEKNRKLFLKKWKTQINK